jgi:hypothetical protein
MLPAAPGPHNHSPPQTFFLTDVDQSFNMKKPASLSSINYRHQIGIHYFLRRNPHKAGARMAAPPNGLVQASNGDFYGTTITGGDTAPGAVRSQNPIMS